MSSTAKSFPVAAAALFGAAATAYFLSPARSSSLHDNDRRPLTYSPPVFPSGLIKAYADPTRFSKDYLDCMVLVGQNMPISGDGRLHAHHYVAGSGKWNEQIRFEPFQPDFGPASLIIDVGGNTRAADSKVFYDKYRPKIHIYEPVMEFFSQLSSRWKGVEGVTLHSAGMGGGNRTIVLSTSSLKGESTFVMEGDVKSSDIPPGSSVLEIVDAASEVRSILSSTGRSSIDLLHLNCEGCEWELMLRLVEEGMLRVFANIQISFHNYAQAGIGVHMPVYCLIREALLKTHSPVHVVTFGWERWVRRGRGGGVEAPPWNRGPACSGEGRGSCAGLAAGIVVARARSDRRTAKDGGRAQKAPSEAHVASQFGAILHVPRGRFTPKFPNAY
jgi:FkbM family methyltransferase